jgi:hypothetical protein
VLLKGYCPWNSSTWEVEAGGSPSLGYIARHCLSEKEESVTVTSSHSSLLLIGMGSPDEKFKLEAKLLKSFL